MKQMEIFNYFLLPVPMVFLFTLTNADSIHRNRTSSCKICRTWKSKRAPKKPSSPVNLSNPMPNSSGSRTNWRSSMVTSIISKMRATFTNSFYTMSNWKMAESTLWSAMVSKRLLGCMLKVGYQLIWGFGGKYILIWIWKKS